MNRPITIACAVILAACTGGAASVTVDRAMRDASSPSHERRSLGADELGALTAARDQAAPVLLNLLTDADAGVRVHACRALGRLRWEDAYPLLTKVEGEDSKPLVRDAASAALRAIGPIDPVRLQWFSARNRFALLDGKPVAIPALIYSLGNSTQVTAEEAAAAAKTHSIFYGLTRSEWADAYEHDLPDTKVGQYGRVVKCRVVHVSGPTEVLVSRCRVGTPTQETGGSGGTRTYSNSDYFAHMQAGAGRRYDPIYTTTDDQILIRGIKTDGLSDDSSWDVGRSIVIIGTVDDHGSKRLLAVPTESVAGGLSFSDFKAALAQGWKP